MKVTFKIKMDNVIEKPVLTRRELLKRLAQDRQALGGLPAASESTKNQLSRRTVVKGILGAAGLLAAGPIARKLTGAEADTASPQPQPTQLAVQPTPAVPASQPAETTRKTEDAADKELLSKIASFPLDSLERKNLEKEYFDRAKTLEQIDLGLGFLFYFKSDSDNNWVLRKGLIDRRFELRQKGDPRLAKVGVDRTKWLEKRNLPPEGTGIALDAREKAKRVLTHMLSTSEGRNKFRADLLHKESIGELPKGYLANMPLEMLVENSLINIGGFARLICTETGWAYQKDAAYPDFAGEKVLSSYPFINLGKKSAISQIDKNVFKEDAEAFRELCKRAEKATGIKINPDFVPGSTAGAVMVQIMPKNLLDIAKMFEEAGEKFVFNDPTDAFAAAWVFLARGNNNPIRYGYFRGDEAVFDRIRKAALVKWNAVDEQVDIIYKDANDYYKEFLKNGRYAR